jgi:glucosylceramidase
MLVSRPALASSLSLLVTLLGACALPEEDFAVPAASRPEFTGEDADVGILAGESVSVWVTTGDQSKKLAQQASVTFAPDTGSNPTTITVDENTTFQIMDGFGAAMTGSSAYLFNRRMSASQRDAVLNDLFTGSGIRLSMVRHTIGASDFSLNSYTYDDKPPGQTDPNLTSFSIAGDMTDVVPMLKEARARNGSLKIMGSPWSAPAWMKEVHNLNGGWLNVAWYAAYANYFVKYIQAYQVQGLPIYAVTIQNEPLHETPSYPSMRMDPANQANFVKNNLGPAFSAAGITTKIIAYDHNWDRWDYPNSVFGDAAAAQYIAGSAFHGYGGTPGLMSNTHNAYPNKDIWFTEISGGGWAPNFADNLRWNLSNIIIACTRNWAKSVLLWNLALDQNAGPINGGCTNCRGVVTVNNGSGAYTREVEYYVLGHASKFVDPGARRIATNTFSGGIENVAFKNPDGSKVLIALNNGGASNTFKVRWGAQAFTYTLPAGAVATFKWSNAGASPGVPVGQVVWLQGINGKYVSSEDGTQPMYCNRDTVQGWEKFDVVDAGGGKIALRGSNGLYVSSENGTAPINCNRPAIGDWEKFDWVFTADGKAAFRGNNGCYISSENGAAAMTCNRTAISGWEAFSHGVTSR